jgi:hypothetical protein
MSSLRKRQANRANALRSTGPKTSAGRSKVAENAVKHGLSVPLAKEDLHGLVSKIAQLIVERDQIDSDTARELAFKIVDFERTSAYERQQMMGTQGATGRGLIPPIGGNAFVHLPTMERWLAHNEASDEYGLYKSAARGLGRIQAEQRKKVGQATLRYNKRAANQLIKALRGLS